MNAYRGYIRFIRRTLRDQGFDHIAVFGPQMTCLLAPLLLRYRHRPGGDFTASLRIVCSSTWN